MNGGRGLMIKGVGRIRYASACDKRLLQKNSRLDDPNTLSRLPFRIHVGHKNVVMQTRDLAFK